MAETAKTPAPVTPEPPPPVLAPVTPSKPPNPFAKHLGKFLSTTTWLVLGAGLILAGIVFRFENPIPEKVRPFVEQLIPHLHYLLCGLGLMCLAHARSLVVADYLAEYRKNRRFQHAWKIPLVSTQVTILYLLGIYGVAVGVKYAPMKNLIGWMILFLLFLGYLLWYAVAHFQNRFPTLAGLRIAMLALILSAISLFSWVVAKLFFFSLIFGIFGAITAVASLTISPLEAPQQRGSWLRALCLVGSIVLVGLVGWHALPFGKTPQSDLVGLGSAAKNLGGDIYALAFSQPGEKHTAQDKPEDKVYYEQRIAFSQKTREGWFLQVINPINEEKPIFKIAAGDEPCSPLFILGGKFILLDPVVKGERRLWKVNAETGAYQVLNPKGFEAFADGTPWSEEMGQLLYVTKTGSNSKLWVLDLQKGTSKALFTASTPLLTPSWGPMPGEISYADGTHGVPCAIVAGKSQFQLSADERLSGEKTQEGPPVLKVLPAPDGFRCLYLVQTGETQNLWEALADGTKRGQFYESEGTLEHIAWMADGQKVVFEEKPRHSLGKVTWKTFFPNFLAMLEGYFLKFETVKIVDANLSTVECLIPPQLSCHSPVPSPDGFKVAFVGNQGLWYPAGFKAGIWVAILR